MNVYLAAAVVVLAVATVLEFAVFEPRRDKARATGTAELVAALEAERQARP